MHMCKWCTECIGILSTNFGVNPERYEAIVHGNTGRVKKSNQFKESIDPSLHTFFETQKAFFEPFDTIIVHEVTGNYLREK